MYYITILSHVNNFRHIYISFIIFNILCSNFELKMKSLPDTAPLPAQITKKPAVSGQQAYNLGSILNVGVC